MAFGLLVTIAATYEPVTAAPARLGTDVRMTAALTGELDVAPRGAFLVAERLPERRHATAVVSVRNQTGVMLSVNALATSSPPAVAERLHVRVHAGEELVADGTAHDLATGSRPWPLESGAAVDLTFEAWLEPSVDGYHADTVRVDVHFETERTHP